MYLECARGLACPSRKALTIPTPQVLLRNVWSIPLVPPWVTASHFLAGNWEAELEPTAFSPLLLFRGFVSFLFSCPPSDIVSLSDACWDYSLITIIPPVVGRVSEFVSFMIHAGRKRLGWGLALYFLLIILAFPLFFIPYESISICLEWGR